ncbi:hypothetical protein FOY91_16510 [Sphingomonas solaris]|uniref:DUF883 family protein n=1 Tax=Alterirhizorhabdus solaris TaxID=2529389 RepID=A0A558QWU6_9SPHN|nr:hypothetical protein FOY91_16510 [Sphingomonas solaris]
MSDAASAAAASASETLSAAREKVAGAYEVAADKTGVALETARERTAAAAEAAREKANAAYASARQTASSARHRTSDGIDESPIAAVIGGIAIGVLIGALLPRSQRETEALGPIGDKLAGIAKGAISAAREAGQGTLDEMGINKDGARQQVDKLLDTASKAASSAGTAAAEAIRQPQS